MEGVTVLSTEVVNNTVSGVSLIALSVFIFIVLVLGTLYYGALDAGDIAVLIGGLLAGFIILFFGLSALHSSYTLQKVLVDDSISFNEFMNYYEVKGHEGEIWKVVPKEEFNDKT